MEKCIIKSFKIKNLFWDRDISINFKDSIKIVIWENGIWKTTILNILYYCLSNKPNKLKWFEFDEIIITFLDWEKAVLKKNDLTKESSFESINWKSRILSDFEEQLDDDLKDYISDKLEYWIAEDTFFEYLSEQNPWLRNLIKRYPSTLSFSNIKHYFEKNYSKELRQFQLTIKNKLKNIEVLYFPTYRRIEEELVNLWINIENWKQINKDNWRLIQFWMNDVIEKFEQIKTEIDILSSKWFTEISSEILSQLISGEINIWTERLQNINEKDIDIILWRVWEKLNKADKLRIRESVLNSWTNNLANEKPLLLYFLDKLIRIYENQTSIDNSIFDFVEKCNKYLVFSNKSIVYKPSEVEFYFIWRDWEEKNLKNILGKLSSWEKQIISLFSKIYLSKSSKFIVLFDEPELSLSIYWQKLLLPDILDSKKCDLLLAVTHSPFIFWENGLAWYADWLISNIKYIN